MEKQLFDWDTEQGGWNQVDTLVFQFYKCKLKVDIGNFKIGTMIDTIVINYDTSKIQLIDGDQEGTVLGEFDLELKVK